MTNDFSQYVTKFFSQYLPMQRGLSINTISAYRDTFLQFLDYINTIKGIKSNKILLSDITYDLILNFLDYLEQEKGASISTRNLRLTGIRTFFKYVQRSSLKHFDHCSSILEIKAKTNQIKPVSYLSMEEIRALFSLPNPDTQKGIRDLAILSTLYEAGARVEELINLTPLQLRLDAVPSIELLGKRRKVRIVPIGKELAQILHKYLDVFKIDANSPAVFFNSQGKKLTRAGVQYILDKYIKEAQKIHPSITRKKVSNHTMRHSKAMHLLEAGVNLIYIRDFLGHTSVQTTEIYARTTPENMRKHIEKSAKALTPVERYSPSKKQELSDWLRKFIK
jgi:site-specific recombinase XerD